ncbi:MULTISPECIES: DEAD/DEAH box helicase [Methanoculleus]|uniref:ATP dependent helicase, Lhr family n=2 Tax=Methanoculleus TaxID=45989 RepID=A3CUY2_METMJ|nr:MULTISPECIES: DEAD/DEAH box helicase [Methanoculleus]ABN57182.1 ATP dependent helicase, Lhr family [Methanoculleus marisnigri JR1]UYU18597.1 DEAD/DEAH box helicase [Methanoculleus submarinus]
MARTSAPRPRSAPQTTPDLLDPRVQEVVRKRGFTGFSAAQEQAIPRLLAGENLVLVAPTGTGKTESAMLPVFDRLLKTTGSGFKALYITPLRSLNRDILNRMEWWCRELGLSVGVRHGDTPQNERRKQALNPPDLLITTPESLQALFMGKRLREHLKNVKYVVVDEIHELADSKRGAQLAVALERLAAYAGEFQRIGLSATVGNPDDIGRFLAGHRPFSLVEVPVASSLDIGVLFAGEDFGAQARAVGKCLDSPGSTLVFVNTRVTAEALGHRLYSRGDVEVHHGSLSRDVRVDAEERFRKGEVRTLIATSSMELGIDIGHIEHVVQFGSPRQVSRLVQRVGRAGHRLDAISRGTVLATGFDDLLESLVIARRAKANECERIVPPAGAADVLANQVAAIAVEYGEIEVSRVREMIERSNVFDGCGPLLDDVCRQMAEHRLIRLDGTRIIRTGRARRYLIENLSMIHDEKKMEIFDMVSRRTVGTLDESFVLGWMHTGAVFITKGQLWRVLEIEGTRITVEPATRAKGEVPSWEGEQIPVPFAVAREVGALRRTRAFGRYSDTPAAIAYAERFMGRMDEGNYPVPTDRLVTLENADEGVVCNVCGGHKANEALARALSVLLSARYGTSVGIEVGAYRFLLRLPDNVRALEVQETLAALEPDHLPGILKLALKRTALFKWKLVQVAKKFGAIDADADYERFSIHRLIDLFDGTVIAAEAYRELFSISMDMDAAQEILAAVHDGRIAVATGRLSPLGSDVLSSSRDMIPPPMVDQAVIGTLARRLEKEDVVLFCMNCRKWKSRTVVERVPDKPQCPLCSARLIAALKPWDEDLIPAVKKKNKSEEERAIEVRFLRNANIVLSSGKKAVTALAAKGVGPEVASRILATLSEGDAFYKEILKAERNYVKTHRYW